MIDHVVEVARRIYRPGVFQPAHLPAGCRVSDLLLEQPAPHAPLRLAQVARGGRQAKPVHVRLAHELPPDPAVGRAVPVHDALLHPGIRHGFDWTASEPPEVGCIRVDVPGGRGRRSGVAVVVHVAPGDAVRVFVVLLREVGRIGPRVRRRGSPFIGNGHGPARGVLYAGKAVLVRRGVVEVIGRQRRPALPLYRHRRKQQKVLPLMLFERIGHGIGFRFQTVWFESKVDRRDGPSGAVLDRYASQPPRGFDAVQRPEQEGVVEFLRGPVEIPVGHGGDHLLRGGNPDLPYGRVRHDRVGGEVVIVIPVGKRIAGERQVLRSLRRGKSHPAHQVSGGVVKTDLRQMRRLGGLDHRILGAG